MIPVGPVRMAFAAGVWCVALLSVLTVGATVLFTWRWWDFLVAGDTPTNVYRNMGLLAAGVVALVFAFWRCVIAKQQEVVAEENAATARLEHLYGRYTRAREQLSCQGIDQSATRISGMYAFRNLVRDAPDEFAAETVVLLTSFARQWDAQRHALKECEVALSVAHYVTTVADPRACTMSRKDLEESIESAIQSAHARASLAGLSLQTPRKMHLLVFTPGEVVDGTFLGPNRI